MNETKVSQPEADSSELLLNQASNIESDINQLQREVKIDDESIIRDSFEVNEDEKEEVANESLTKDGYCGENINEELGEAPTIPSDFQYQEKLDLHESLIEFKEADIVEVNNSGTTTVTGVNQVLCEEVNVIKEKSGDEALEQMSSIIEDKENEATTIPTYQDSDSSTIFVEQNKCDEPHSEEQQDPKNVDDTNTEKEERNICFEHADQEKDHDPSNKDTNIESDINQLQREVKIDDETINKDSFNVDENDKEEFANESFKMDGFCGDNINEEMGEAPTIPSDFEHQEKLDLHETLIEFKEGDVVEVNNRGTTTVDSVNQDLNVEVNIIKEKSDDEAFEQRSFVIKDKENAATTIPIYQEGGCSTIFVEQSNCDESHAEDHNDIKNVDDTNTEKEEHNICYEHADQENDHGPSNQATNIESDINELQREVKIDYETITNDRLKVDEDDNEEAANESFKKDGFCGENINEELGDAATIPSYFEHQEKLDLHESLIEFKEGDFVEVNNSGTITIDSVNQDLNAEVNVIKEKSDDEAFEQMNSVIEDKEKETTTIPTYQESGCSTIFVEQSKCDESHAEDDKDNKNVDDTNTQKEEHNICFEYADQEKDHDPSNQATNIESNINQLQREVKIDDQTIIKDSFEVDEDDNVEVANESFKKDGFCGEAPTIPSDFQHQENLDVHESLIEFNEEDIVEVNNSGTTTLDSVNQGINEEVNVVQEKSNDEAFEQTSSVIEDKENEATTITTYQESDGSTIFVEQSKCDEPHDEEHKDIKNVDDTNTEKEEHNICFEHAYHEKDQDPSNQDTNIESDINQLQREVKIYDESIIKDGFKVDVDDKEEIANESFKTDDFCGENINEEFGEATTIPSDFQHQEILDLHESLIEFKEGDIVEVNHSGRTTLDSVNQDLNEEVNVIQEKSDNEAFEQTSSVIEDKKNEATTISTYQEGDCSTIFVEQSKCDEPHGEEHKDIKNVDDTNTEKEEHNICFEHAYHEKDQDPSNQATNIESDINQLQREVKIYDESIIKDGFKVDVDDKEEVANESFKKDDFCGENINEELGKATTIPSDFQHQEILDLHESLIELKEGDIIEVNHSGRTTLDSVNQGLNEEVNVIQEKSDDEPFEQTSSVIKDKENEATTISTYQEGDCSTIFVEQSKCDEPHAEEHKDIKIMNDTNTEKEEHNICFEHADYEKDHDPSNQDLNVEVNVIQEKGDDEAFEKKSSVIEDIENEAITILTYKESDCSTILVEQSKGDEPHAEEHKDIKNMDNTNTEKEKHSICFEHADQGKDHDSSNQATNFELDIIQLQREVNVDEETIIKDSFNVDEDDKEEVAKESLKKDDFCGENINEELGEAPTSTSNFQYQQKIDLNESSIEFKEVEIVEVNNSGTTTVNGGSQDLNEEVNVIQEKNDDKAFKQKSSIFEVKENEATTIQANHVSDCSMFVVEQRKCNESHAEVHKDNKNVDNTDTEKGEHNTCFELEDPLKDHDLSNQATNIESDISQLQREVKIDDETIIKDCSKVDEDDKEEVANECLKKDCLFGESINEELGEAPTIASDFQHQEKLDLQESLIEFKEGDIVEANNSVTTTVDSMNQDVNEKVNVIQEKSDDEAFEITSSIIEDNENEATTIPPYQESDCSMLIFDQSKCDEPHAEEHKDSKNVDNTNTEKEEHADQEKDHDPSNQAINIESDINQIQSEVKINDETINKESFNVDEDDNEQVANESLKKDGFCGENINKEMVEASTIPSDIHHTEKIDLHESSIEFKEVEIVEANNGGTPTVDGGNQDLNKEVNVVQENNDDKAFEQMSSIFEVKDNEATTIQTNNESDCSMIIVNQSKCNEPHAKAHKDTENVDDIDTEKEEYNTCFEHEDQQKNHDPSNQVTNIELDVIQIQREVEIDDETILKDSFKLDEFDKEEALNQSLKKDFGENINNEIREAPTIASDFQQQEKMDLHESSIEFKELDIIEANNSGTTNVDGENQDFNAEENVTKEKNDDEVFEQMSSIIEIKENEASTVPTNLESYCSTIFIEQRKCNEPHADEHKDNENMDDPYTEKEEHNTCFENEDQEKDYDASNQAANIESDINELQREVNIDETIIRESFNVDEDDKEEVANESLRNDGFCGENINKEIRKATTIASDFQHQEKIDLHESSIEFKQVDIVEANNNGTSTVDVMNEDLNEEVHIIQGKNEDEAFEQISSIIEFKENEATTIQTNQESDCSTIFVKQSKCDERHAEEHKDSENVEYTDTEKVKHNTCFEHKDQEKDNDASNQATNIGSDIIQLQREVKINDETIIKDSFKVDEDDKEEVANECLKNDDFCGENINKEMGEAPTTTSNFQQQEKIDLHESSIEFKEVNIVETNNSGTTTVHGVNEVEEHKDNEYEIENDTYMKKEEYNTCFQHDDPEEDQDPSYQGTNKESNNIHLQRDEKSKLKEDFEVDPRNKDDVENGSCKNEEISEAHSIARELEFSVSRKIEYDVPLVEEHKNNDIKKDIIAEEREITYFEHEEQKQDHFPSNQIIIPDNKQDISKAKEVKEATKDKKVIEAKASDEEEIEASNQRDFESGMTVRDIDLKTTHKKSLNILSGVGSKVKHSISKVKKAMTCTSAPFATEDVIIKLNKNKK